MSAERTSCWEKESAETLGHIRAILEHMEIFNIRLDAIEEVLQKHNQWIAEMQNRRKDHEHVPHDTLEDYKQARRNLLEFLSFAHSGDAEQQPAGLLDKIIDLVANYKNARTAQELVDKYK